MRLSRIDLQPRPCGAAGMVFGRSGAGIFGIRFGVLDLTPSAQGTLTMSRTQPALIYRWDRNVGAAKLLGRTRLKRTVSF